MYFACIVWPDGSFEELARSCNEHKADTMGKRHIATRAFYSKAWTRSKLVDALMGYEIVHIRS